MAQDRVLVIVEDEWESAILNRVLVEAKHEVAVTGTAREGVARAKAWLPHCIVCDISLPDIEGLWVARMIRLDPTPLSSTPFLFLAKDLDKDAHLQGFNVGADVFLMKPYRTEEAVGQVGALIAMARRMEGRMSFGPVSSAAPPAMRGDLGQIDLTTVLTLLEMERRTGALKARVEGGQTASFELIDGSLARSTLDDQPADPIALFRRVFGWKKGRFWFRAGPVEGATGPGRAVGPLLLASLQLIDEEGR